MKHKPSYFFFPFRKMFLKYNIHFQDKYLLSHHKFTVSALFENSILCLISYSWLELCVSKFVESPGQEDSMASENDQKPMPLRHASNRSYGFNCSKYLHSVFMNSPISPFENVFRRALSPDLWGVVRPPRAPGPCRAHLWRHLGEAPR